MRLLLDEMLPRKLAGFFAPEIEAVTVRQRGWGEKTNGELIEAAQREFDVLVTMDRGIPHQQNLSDVNLMIVLLEARSNRLEDLMPLVKQVKKALVRVRSGEIVRVTAS
jgi:predicted nuclease of predicted toxin-antitoxin system